MSKFLSKLQYKHYEAGEFADEQERTEEEIVKLVKDFPWVEQCSGTPVGPTSPSVTIENSLGVYLKIAHSYGGKFILYLFDERETFYKKIVLTLDDCCTAVHEFCTDTIDLSTFHHESLFQGKRHFETKDFTFHVTRGMLFSIILSFFPAVVLLALLILMAFNFTGMINGGGKGMYFLLPVVLGAFLFSSYVSGRALSLYYNHFNYSLFQFITISKGKNEFVFGTEEHHEVYLKDELTLVKIYRNPQTRSPMYGIEVYELLFKNGNTVKISSLLLKQAASRFPTVQFVWVNSSYPKIY